MTIDLLLLHRSNLGKPLDRVVVVPADCGLPGAQPTRRSPRGS